MRGTELILQSLFHRRLLASLQVLLAAISQHGPHLGGGGRSPSEKGGGGLLCPVREACKGSIPLLPGRESLSGLEVVHGYEVSRQVKDGPPQSHGPVLSPDVSGDGVKGAEGGNPDPLQVVEKGRAAGLWASWLEEEPM